MRKNELTNETEHKALNLKIETGFQRHKDDVQRLELGISWLKMLSKASHLNPHTKNLQMANSEQIETEIELVARIFSRLDKEEGDCNDRICPNCEKEYVSVVFLPCTHHVLGIGCGDSYGKKRRPCICLLRLSNSAEDCGICCTILVIVASYLDVTCLIRNTPKPSILIHLKQVGTNDF